MNKYFVLVCLCFLAGCRSLTSSPSAFTADKSAPVVIPAADELKSVTLIVIGEPVLQFVDDLNAACDSVHLTIADPLKIKTLTAILHEMNPRVAPQLHLTSNPVWSRLILERKEEKVLSPNELKQLNLVGDDKSFSFFTAVLPAAIKGQEPFCGGYDLECSSEGVEKLNQFLKEEFQTNRNNPDVCVIKREKE